MIDIPSGWCATGFGGEMAGRQFIRVTGRVEAIRNGSYVDLYVSSPDDEHPWRLALMEDELREILDSTHGVVRILRVETDIWDEHDA